MIVYLSRIFIRPIYWPIISVKQVCCWCFWRLPKKCWESLLYLVGGPYSIYTQSGCHWTYEWRSVTIWFILLLWGRYQIWEIISGFILLYIYYDCFLVEFSLSVYTTSCCELFFRQYPENCLDNFYFIKLWMFLQVQWLKLNMYNWIRY